MKTRSLVQAAFAAACVTLSQIPTSAAAFSAADCVQAPDPVGALSFGSRYSDAGSGSTQLDAQADAAVDDALRPVDDFLRDLTDLANTVHEDPDAAPQIASCVLDQIGTWARADALGDLERNARLTIGSRLAGFGLILLQTIPHAERHRDLPEIRRWLAARMTEQMTYWEAEAPDGAAQGNLRAWAALAGATTGIIVDDPIMRGWAAWSVSYIVCTAEPDGSLPQEMSRGRFALHYQLHAIAPLTVSAALLGRTGLDVTDRCDHALERIVLFAVNDLETGAATRRITGKTQTFFDGTHSMDPWRLAWLEAYLTINFDPQLVRLADGLRPLSYSKLGGDQTLMWQALRF